MAKNGCSIMRQTITVTATLTVAFSLFCYVILNSVVSTAVSLCLYQPAGKEGVCMDFCCAGIETSPDCCCYLGEMPNQNDTLILYEPFGKSIYSNICAVHTFDSYNLKELYNVDCETQNSPKYIAYKIFRPPKA